jgi:hypothetical protein
MHFTRALPFLLLAVSGPVAAETCKYVDAEGRIIYSNTPNNPPKGAKKVKCFEDPAPRPAPAAEAPRSGSDGSPAQPPRNADQPKSEFPKVDGETQRKRDLERQKILEEELANEEQALEQARQELAEQEAVRTGGERNYQRYLDRVQPFRDAVSNHERNIEAIRRELNTLR